MDETQALRQRIERVVTDLAGGKQTAFATALNESTQNVSNYLSGRSKSIPAAFLARILAAYKQVDAAWLLTGEGRMMRLVKPDIYSPGGGAGLIDMAQRQEPGSTFQGIPVVGEIPAGQLVMMEYIDSNADEYLPIYGPWLTHGEGDVLFGLRIYGDSMESWMYHGDVAICSAFQTPDVRDDVAYYSFETGESTVKRLLSFDRTKKRIRLNPINPKYEDFAVDLKQGDQLCRVLWIVRNARLRLNPR